MTNDAKLGMLAGVLGVIAAAVLLANAPPPAAQSPGPAPSQANHKGGPPQSPQPPSPPALVSPGASPVETPATPVARTRKDVNAQPTSRSGGTEEEP